MKNIEVRFKERLSFLVRMPQEEMEAKGHCENMQMFGLYVKI